MLLAERWPTADVVGFDSSPEMIERARELDGDRVRFVLDDATAWAPDQPVDVIISNALLHWIDGHDQLAARWFGSLAPDGWLAFQVPGNFTSPAHRQIGEQLAEPRWRDALPAGFEVGAASFPPERYLEVLSDVGADVDAWETTYLHVLSGARPGPGVDQGHRPAPDPGRARRRRRRARVPRRARGPAPAGVPSRPARDGLPVPTDLRGRAPTLTPAGRLAPTR